jgi:branched-chain amino acid transport system permease protein
MKQTLILAVVLAAAAPLFPLVGGSWDMMVRIMVWAIMGLGFDILFGFTGLLSFGTAAFVGTGGFVAGLLMVRGVTDNLWLALVGGTIASGLLGIVLGFFAVRRIGIYFAMITLAFGQMAYFLENGPLSAWTGGENGLPGVPLPTLFGHHIAPGPELYAVTAVLFLAGYALALRIVNSPFGLVLSGIKANTGTSWPPLPLRPCMPGSPVAWSAASRAMCRPTCSRSINPGNW